MSDIPSILHQVLAGRYVLKREIGRGGAATVYLAHDVRHERLVAIKVLHPELSHALGAQRFMREIKLTANLQHPHILPIHDSGQADEQLYYVMPYVEGESLRQRLGADNRLSIEAAVRIGREVAGALAYAHERGVVHRDIKPENILFSGGHAVLADFGIARAINRASEKITEQGTITGTPAYMSPEQARDRAFDGRSDVYSLSCVLYEAIAGVPPYVGDTPQQLLSQRIVKAPPLLREYRHDVPPPIEAVIAKALAISPDDRYDDARAFSAALSAAVGNSGETLTMRSRRRSLSRNPYLWAAGVTLLVAGGAATSPRARDRIDILTGRVDSLQYAVVPFQYVGAPAPASDVEPASSAMYDAMRQWDGLRLASEMSVSDAVKREAGRALSLDDVSRIARSVHAGRAVWGRVRATRDSVVIRAGVYDALTGQNVREVTRVVHSGNVAALSDVDFRALVADLLRVPRAMSAPVSSAAERGTVSFAAWQAFERGAAALAEWDVAAATSAFEQSIAADPAYPQANLWLAQLRSFGDDDPKAWTTPLVAAQRHRGLLDAREQALADALGDMASSDYPAACRAYAGLRTADSLDVLAWLGLTYCQERDRTIVRSPRSPTGYAFRGSAEAAWRAVSRALEIEPNAFTVVTFETLRRIRPIEENYLRAGRLGNDWFMAMPSLRGDSLVFLPLPAARAAVAEQPASYEAALTVGRDRMLATLTLLTRRLPENADAFESLASLLETRDEITGTPNGSYSALTALERARSLASSDDQRLRLAVVDVRLHLKLGDFARSARTADSILAAPANPTPHQAYLLRGLAAYTGRLTLAARYHRLSGDREYRADAASLPAAEDALSALLIRSALGICDDSIGTLIGSVKRTVESYVDPAHRAAELDKLLEHAVSLSGMCQGGAVSLQVGRTSNPWLTAMQAIARGDRPAAVRIVDSIDATRRTLQAGGVSLDFVVVEALLHDAIGDTRGAAARLDPTLSALPTLATFVVTEPTMAGAVGRAMVYRADLARRLGDPSTAALWAGRVLTLWAHADASLAPVMTRMRALARPQPIS